jgi:hypothetical protein
MRHGQRHTEHRRRATGFGRQFLGPTDQLGQAIVLVALMIIVLFGAVGLAVDGGLGYYYNTQGERAAGAAALAGVIFMPNQLGPAQAVPAGSRNDAADRAVDEARRNGYDVANVADAVTVTTSAVPGFDNKLSVTVTRTVHTFFMQVFGISSYQISRTAVATYLPPISVGQPGNEVGSTVSQLGTSGFYFLRTEGSATDRGQGDAYTPANNPGGGCSACPSDDVHRLSQTTGTDLADTTLPARGGYNYRITVPAGSSAIVQVYNAAFSPDDNSGSGGPGPNFCENAAPGSPTYACSPGGNYYMHETDCCSFNFSNAATYSMMEYTLFSEPNAFIPSADTKLTQMVVDPLDARGWNANPPTYKDVRTNSVITQAYNANGTPVNGLAYHAWMDVASHVIDPTDQGMIAYKAGPLAGSVGVGQYRLRIDTLEMDGSNPPSNGLAGSSFAHKGLAVRVMDGTGLNPCATCTLTAIDDMAIYTPIALPGPGGFQLPLFQLPPDYAGKTIKVDIFDMGDMSGTGSIYVGFIDPRTNALLDLTGTGTTATVWNLGTQLSNVGTSNATVVSQPTVVEQLVTSGSSYYADNKWYEFDIPIPGNYNPGPNPANWWWKLQYRTTANVTATDTITVLLGLKGNPAHLLQS